MRTSIVNTQVYNPQRLEMQLLQHKWCVIRCPFTTAGLTWVNFIFSLFYLIDLTIILSNYIKQSLTGVKEQKEMFKKSPPPVPGG